MIDTEEKAKQKVIDTWNAKELFIILSESQYHDGRSVPRMFRVSENDISLGIFTTYEAAADFCRNNYIIDGKCLVGRIDNTDKFRDLFNIVNTAMHIGANWTDIDCGTEDAMHIKLALLLEWGGRKPGKLSVLVSKDALERIQTSGKIPLRFNEMPLYEPRL